MLNQMILRKLVLELGAIRKIEDGQDKLYFGTTFDTICSKIAGVKGYEVTKEQHHEWLAMCGEYIDLTTGEISSECADTSEVTAEAIKAFTNPDHNIWNLITAPTSTWKEGIEYEIGECGMAQDVWICEADEQ